MQPSVPRRRKLTLRAKLFLGAVAVALAATTAIGLLTEFAPPPGPEQPIAFSHRVHAGTNQIDCLFCHTAASRSPSAGLPSVERCMACHQYIAVRRPEIRKLADFWEQRQPIPWVRVHRLPDYVYFSHKRHVKAGVACQTCHGPVQEMEVVYQYAPLTMGWCLECHQQPQGTPVNEIREAASSYEQMARGATRASLDCVTCHK
jgi:hypothetical protein